MKFKDYIQPIMQMIVPIIFVYMLFKNHVFMVKMSKDFPELNMTKHDYLTISRPVHTIACLLGILIFYIIMIQIQNIQLKKKMEELENKISSKTEH